MKRARSVAGLANLFRDALAASAAKVRPAKSHHRFPACTEADQRPILAVVHALRGADRRLADALLERIGSKGLCSLLHAMRRWYVGQTGVLAAKMLVHRAALIETRTMDLRTPLRAYRGFKVPRTDDLADVYEGERVDVPVCRNGGCSSWTLDRDRADKFSGASPGKVGLVVKLIGGEGVTAFLAPPERTAPWFDHVYERTMGRSHRFVEREYAVHAEMLRVAVVRVKRTGRKAA